MSGDTSDADDDVDAGDEPDEVEAPTELKKAHELTTKLRADGYSVGFDADDLVDDFDDHREQSIALLEADDVSAFFLVVERDQQTDFSSSVVVSDPVVYGVSQIQMLGAHFRTVLDNTGLETTELVESMVDEALVIDETTEEQ